MNPLLLTPRQALFECRHPDGTVIWADSVESALGRAAFELGQSQREWAGFIHPHDRERAAHQLDEAWRGNTDCHRSYRFLDQKGVYRWIHECSFAVGPSPARRLGIVVDVTESRRLEARLRKPPPMDQAFAALAESLSHELGRIITPILLASQLTMDAQTDPRPGPLLDIILTSALRGFALTSQIRTLAYGGTKDPAEPVCT